jgi:hypothetical protein
LQAKQSSTFRAGFCDSEGTSAVCDQPSHYLRREFGLAEWVHRFEDRQAARHLAVGRLINEAVEVAGRVEGSAVGVGQTGSDASSPIAEFDEDCHAPILAFGRPAVERSVGPCHAAAGRKVVVVWLARASAASDAAGYLVTSMRR